MTTKVQFSVGKAERAAEMTELLMPLLRELCAQTSGPAKRDAFRRNVPQKTLRQLSDLLIGLTGEESLRFNIWREPNPDLDFFRRG